MTDEHNQEVEAAAEATPPDTESVKATASDEQSPAGDQSGGEGEAPVSGEPADDGEAAHDPPEVSADAEKTPSPETADDDAMLAMLQNVPEEGSDATAADGTARATVGKAEFQQLSQPAARPAPANIDLLMDINLPVSIELGRTRMSIADILAIGPGSVVELDKLAGEPVDVMVNHKLVAKGEVVVIDENFGVRVTQLLTPEERLKLLGEDQ